MDTNKLMIDSFNKALELYGQDIKIMDSNKILKDNTKAIDSQTSDDEAIPSFDESGGDSESEYIDILLE